MGVPPLLAVLVFKLAVVFSYEIEPDISWPEEYHFSGERINLISGVVKPFEIWYSAQRNKSRSDYYGGLVKRIFDSALEGDQDEDDDAFTSVYLFHSKVDENGNPVVECEKTRTFQNFDDFLPNLEGFDFHGHTYHSGHKVSVWKKDTRENDMEHRLTLYVAPGEDNVMIPVQMETKAYDMMNGGLKRYVVENYYSYRSDLQDEDFAIDKNSCVDVSPFDLEWAHSRLDPHIETDVEMAFYAYKKHHKREYKEAEHEMRKHIYRGNWELVKEHNSQNLSYKLTMNDFADRTDSELRHLTATKFTEPIVGTHEFPYTAEKLQEIAAQLPVELDLRSQGYVSPVLNQGECGSCWAFAITTAVESAVTKSMNGQMVDLSEQSLVDCAWNFDSRGCDGSTNLGSALAYVKKYGIPTARDYGPYLEEDGECKIKNMTNVYKIRGYVAVTPYSINSLKAAIFNTGVVTVAVDFTRAMMLYSSGIIYDVDCRPDRSTHAVAVVGYGYRYGDPYWIVKNSWGERWGQDGYFLISAKDNNCGVMSSPVYPLL